MGTTVTVQAPFADYIAQFSGVSHAEAMKAASSGFAPYAAGEDYNDPLFVTTDDGFRRLVYEAVLKNYVLTIKPCTGTGGHDFNVSGPRGVMRAYCKTCGVIELQIDSLGPRRNGGLFAHYTR